MTGTQLSVFLNALGEQTSLDRVRVVMQFGEGEEKEIAAVRVVTELTAEGNGSADQTVVIRGLAPKRNGADRDKARIAKEKKEAEEKKPRTKEGEA